jgi:methyl-accepting chemotaxis protein
MKINSIAAKINVVAGSMALLFFIIAAFIQVLTMRNIALIGDVDRNFSKLDDLILPLEKAAKEMKLDVVQVQQFLTDISATRALDGLDDGFKEAEENAVELRRDAVTAQQLADKLGDRELREAIDKVAADFERYYAEGKRMAQLYIDEGPSGGNAQMPAFDKQADALGEQIDELVKKTEASTKRGRAETSEAIVQLGATVSFGRIINFVLTSIAFAWSVLAAILLRRLVSRPLLKITEVMGILAGGRLDVAVPGLDRNDEIGGMAKAMEKFKANALALQDARAKAAAQEDVARQEREERARRDAEAAEREAERARQAADVVETLGAALEGVARGDLTARLDRQFAEGYKKVQLDFNTAVEHLHRVVSGIIAATHEINGAAAEVAVSTTDLSQRTEQQAASLEQTTASMQLMSDAIKTSAESAHQASALALSTRDVAEASGKVVTAAVQAMGEISESSQRIGDIIGMIDEIARQTNLLALNAAVEAARAGDAGRGFAVVASEVRSLAQRSSQAANDIKGLIGNSSSHVSHGVELVNRAGASLGEILESIQRLTTIVSDITTASNDQAARIENINAALSKLEEFTQQNSALVEENAAATKTLEYQSQSMKEQVSLFRLDRLSADEAREEIAAVA